jgi:sphinganine-1-phosphate aldolase
MFVRIVPDTAHAAFDKAAHFFRMKIHHVKVDPVTKKVDSKRVRSYINSNTCMVTQSINYSKCINYSQKK